jgi:MFS family permease
MSGKKPANVLRNRNFALLWSGQTISVAGNGVFNVALPLEVLNRTRSPLILGVVVGSKTIVTVVLLLIGGVVVDRLPRRAVMTVSDTTCAIAVGGAALLIAVGKIATWQLIVLSMIMGLAYAFFMPASTAIIPDILPADSLVDGSSLSSLGQSLAQYLAGPAAGGLIVAAAGADWAFGIDAASFAVSAACLLAMRVSAKPAVPHASTIREMSAGLRYARSQPWLWWSMVALGIANVFSFVPIVILEALLVKNVFRAGSLALGLLYASSGLGRSLAAIYVKWRGAPRRRVLAMWISWSAEGVCAVLLGLSPTIWLATALACAVGIGGSYGNVLWFPTIQEEVPQELIGRVSSLDWLLSLALAPLGVVLGGAAAGAIGVRLTLALGGAIAACTGSVLLLPGVTDPGRKKQFVPANQEG